MKYLKVWTSFRDLLHRLEYDEIGRLFLMMLAYAETGEEPTEFIGNEAFLFPVAKQQIDLATEKVETLRQNGSKGGLAKSKNRQALANDSKSYQSVANGSKSKQNVAYKVKECNVKECNETESLIADDDAQQIQTEQNRVWDAAEDAGFIMSNDVRSSLIALYASYSLEKVLDGLKSCSDHGAPTLAYLKAVLSGKPRKQKPSVVAQDYQQRDYTGVQAQIEDETDREMEEFMRSKEVG